MQQRGLWKIKESHSIYKTPWLEVLEHKVIRPDGTDGIFSIVDVLSGSAVLPIDDEGRIYLVKDYRLAIDQDSLELPGGGIEEGEDPLATAKRELKEELGIEAAKWIELGYFHPFTSMSKSSSHLFLAKKLVFKEAHQDSTEQIQMVKMPFAEAVKKVMQGEIKHGTSCLLILKAKEYLEKKVNWRYDYNIF